MPCTPVDLGNGAFAIVCTKGTRAKPCRVCGRRSSRLCDFELAGKKAGKTCDMPLCEKCAVRIGPDKGLCPAHAKLRQPELDEQAVARKAEAAQLELLEQPGLAREGWG